MEQGGAILYTMTGVLIIAIAQLPAAYDICDGGIDVAQPEAQLSEESSHAEAQSSNV